MPGVSEVASIGGFVKQYQVEVDPNRLMAYGLSIQQVRRAIQRSNDDVGGKLVEMGETEFMVRSLATSVPAKIWNRSWWPWTTWAPRCC